MRCEVVAIGTELLLGQIVDTNSSWIGEQLAIAGIDSLYQTKVGDNMDRMVETLELALDRSDAVICCGGLGPTQDDITKEAIAKVMGVDLELDDEIAARIELMFKAILPDLQRRAGETSTIFSRTLRTWGESESGLAERLAGRIAVLDGS